MLLQTKSQLTHDELLQPLSLLYSSCETGWNDLTLVFSTPIPGLLFCFPHAPRIDDGISYISEGAFLRGMKDLHAHYLSLRLDLT